VAGAIMTIVSVPFNLVGAYLWSAAIGAFDFRDTNEMPDVVEHIGRVTTALGSMGTWLSAGGTLLVVGAAFVTYSLHWGRLRTRWFFWMAMTVAITQILQPWLFSSFATSFPFAYASLAFGVFWLWYLLWTKHEFESKARLPLLP
jgi:hypothetical protein